MKICAMGTGGISKSMLPEFQKSDVLECYAVLSRSQESGQAFARQFGIPKVYTDMEEMLADPQIEMVYVASPNSIHYSQTRAALLAGKHVLCEKPFAPTVAQARELMDLAREKGLLLFEAITTAHHPHYGLIRRLLEQLGPVKLVSCIFCQYSSRYPALLAGKVSPVLDPAYKGGALMDINLYNIHFVVGLFGAPDEVIYRPNRHSNGVDTSGVLTLVYPDFLCQCIGAKDCAADNAVQIVGEKGYLEITPCSSNLQTVKLCLRGQEPVEYHMPENPWYHEVQDIGRLVAARDYEACYAGLETTLQVVEILEKARLNGRLGF